MPVVAEDENLESMMQELFGKMRKLHTDMQQLNGKGNADSKVSVTSLDRVADQKV